MSTVLIAKATATGFKRERLVQVRKDGGFQLPPSFAGSLESGLWRNGVAQLLSDAAIMTVDVQLGTSPTYRLSSC